MAIELHHLHPSHDDELSRLKARTAELKALNHDLCERVTENDDIRLHWEEIEQTRAENERMKARIAELEEERRWRKFPDEKPEEDTWCIVFHDGEIDSDNYTRFAYNNKCDFALYGNEVTHWMSLPSAPKEGE
jgi:regulator of replication initiation timing